MTLTDAERRQLGLYAEWRDIQIAHHNLSTYLHYTRTEDVQCGYVMEAVEDLATRRAAFLARWRADVAQATEVQDAALTSAGAVADGGLSDGESDDSAVRADAEG
jgi:hypothetical protein